ncbi:hypothetical protein Tco_0922693 [Tanacetum coccineum]|uniref:Uncharacterized protein n=1 Tax=Tanacetum coccineum TaxID=301880 RepID=A0ABQ5D624_9ASTR
MNALPHRSLIEKEKLNGTNFLDWHELEDYSSMKESWTSLRHPFLTLLLMMLLLLSGCQDGGGNGLTKTLLITHLCDRHCNGDAQAIIRQSLSTNLFIFNEAKGSDFMSPLNFGDGVVRFVLYDLTKPHVPSSLKHLDHVDDFFGLRTVKSIPPKCRLGFSRVLKEALDKVICTPDDISCWSFPGGSLQLMRETLAESSSPLSDVHEEYIDLGEGNINQCKRKICVGTLYCGNSSSFPHSVFLLTMMLLLTVVLDRIKSFPRGTSCRRDGLRTQHLMDCLIEAVALFGGVWFPRSETPLAFLYRLGIRMMALLLEIGVLKKASELVMDLWT